ncbi:RNA 2',3'-cyclic phosphodiesterase [Streptomyces sp. N50]|uniref:RNA 2',3'-cyclic phosphodiesterase n=1 Tax=Streptomyces sp. N50 TaxID=3081765 RepID=UPI0029621E81|nr:RNA 2',3'-cyclic phosphodiesterase [Streptomyces sp. N50]WOX10482.1 RNA 2',3'-cyclic phosphodiesterase [Streptomyces sp. N50]
MRLFAALLPPEDVLAQLGAAVDELQGLPGADALRWTSRPGWHFTLAFYGEVDEDAVPALSAALERTARRTEPFGLAVRGGGQFGQGRALWAGVEGDVAALRQLAERCEEAAPTSEHRRYRAHLTVARGRDAMDVRPYLDRLDDFAGRAWTVDELVLVRSNLPRSGVPGEQPRYEAVARWALGAAG